MSNSRIFLLVALCILAYGIGTGVTYKLYDSGRCINTAETAMAGVLWPLTLPARLVVLYLEAMEE
jgi:hypothetical protein